MKTIMINDIESVIDVKLMFALMSGKVTNAINRVLAKELKSAKIEISPAQVTVLFALLSHDGITQKTLADLTSKDKPSITRLLDNMDKLKLVERRADPTDRRVNKVFLTKRGRNMEGEVRKAAVAAMQSAFIGMNEKDVNNMMKLMKLTFENLTNAAPENESI